MQETFIPTAAMTKKSAAIPNNQYDIVVFSHLRWDFVFQRPQHLLSRMAADNRILFVEEPIHSTGSDLNSAIVEQKDGITVLKPIVESIDDIGPMLHKYISNSSTSIAWFYTGAFSSVLNYIKADKVVYDCMDELSMFKGADPQLIQHEQALMNKADIVFTGGKSLYEAKTKHHRNVHCFPSSVDKRHFAKSNYEIPEDMQVSGPIVGYYGVIDERIDLQLLEATAEKLPYVSFVMIGPVVKIEEHSLPRPKNIHYLGMKAYADLPKYLAHFDIAMMPFALNDSTKFISPTKTLEFMAAEKPIISTPIYDVIRDYSECVSVVADAHTFAQAIEDILNQNDSERAEVCAKFNTILNATSWDATVAKMNFLINSI